MATTTRREDYLGRDLLNEATNATDFMGRATTATADYLGRPLTVTPWTLTTAYAVGATVYLPGEQELVCIVAGTTAGTAPTAPALGATVVDGTVTWRRTE